MILTLTVYTTIALVMAWLGWHVSHREQRLMAAGGAQLSILSWELVTAMVIYVVVSALRWQLSWDYNMYYSHFVAMQSLGEYSRENFEPGFKLITLAFAKSGAHFAFYFAFWAAVQIILLTYALRHRKVLLPWLALCIFLGPYYIFWMGFIRQSVVEALFVVMVELIVRRKLWLYMLLSVVAVCIHKMCVLFFPLYLVPLIPVRTAKRWLPFTLLAFFVLIGSFPQWIQWLFDRIGQFAQLLGYGHYYRLFMSNDLEYAFRMVIGPARLCPLISFMIVIWFYPAIKRMFSGDMCLSATFRFSLVYMCYINLFANTTQYLSRPGELMRTCFVIMICYAFHYLWRERKWIPLLVLALCNFYYIYYEMLKATVTGGSIYAPEFYRTFLF